MNEKAKLFLTRHLEDMTEVSIAMKEISIIHGEDGEGGIVLFGQAFQKIAFSYLGKEEESIMQNFIEFTYDVTLSLDDIYKETIESFDYETKKKLIYAFMEDMIDNMNWTLNFNGIKDDIDVILNVCRIYDARNGLRISDKASAAILGFSTDCISELGVPSSKSREIHEEIISYLAEEDSEINS
jgi:hypothetical protein